MNREQKRLMQRQGHVDADGQPVARQRERPNQPRQRQERTSPIQFAREVRQELRKVAWPSRSEVVNYAVVVLITLIVMTVFIAAIDWVFGEAILWLFNV
ncbi:MAG: preprotein translocase subunit SecE [Actinomycetota bacterium]|nr:preprotein translocase subunit SecE [Actinomycetota bacterium]